MVTLSGAPSDGGQTRSVSQARVPKETSTTSYHPRIGQFTGGMSEGFWFPKDGWYKMIGGTWRFGYGLTLIHGIDLDIYFNFQVLQKEYI